MNSYTENGPRCCKPLSQPLWSLVRVVVLMLYVIGPRASSQEAGGLTPTEHYVLAQVSGGKEANLSAAHLADRSLSPEFVAQLLAGGYKSSAIGHRGVRISFAVFTRPLDVSNAAIPYAFWCRNCDFRAGVDLSYAQFGHDFSLEDSRFGVPTEGRLGSRTIRWLPPLLGCE